jgi:hypothetical protein
MKNGSVAKTFSDVSIALAKSLLISLIMKSHSSLSSFRSA